MTKNEMTRSRMNLPYFFFQADDGIRYRNVTGVQTCALPICPESRARSAPVHADSRSSLGVRPSCVRYRSEERRVGKECRYRWSPNHLKKKKQKYLQHIALVRDLGYNRSLIVIEFFM